MNREYIATITVSIEANTKKVWDALTNPDLIRDYMSGTELETTWEIFTPIYFTRFLNGQPYTAKGVLLEIKPESILCFSYWSPLWKMADSEENYTQITYSLSESKTSTQLTIEQDNLTDLQEVNKAKLKWIGILNKIKVLLEMH